jgi:hypothetical protein
MLCSQVNKAGIRANAEWFFFEFEIRLVHITDKITINYILIVEINPVNRGLVIIRLISLHDVKFRLNSLMV